MKILDDERFNEREKLIHLIMDLKSRLEQLGAPKQEPERKELDVTFSDPQSFPPAQRPFQPELDSMSLLEARIERLGDLIVKPRKTKKTKNNEHEQTATSSVEENLE